MKTIIRKIKVCYYILTSHTYYVFCLDKEPKVAMVDVENPTEFIDNVIIEFLKSEDYKELKKEFGYEKKETDEQPTHKTE